MSTRDLENFLSRHRVIVPERESNYICVLLSDSKAERLHRLSDNLDNFPIEYLYRKGATTSECLELLQSKLPEIEEKYQKPALVYVWTGTCDITRKSKSNRGKVVVRSSGDKTINSVIQKYREILTFVLKRGGRVKFVGVPTYSVTLYNRHRNPRNTYSEAEADIEVDRQVRLLNSKIEELNKEIGRNR